MGSAERPAALAGDSATESVDYLGVAGTLSFVAGTLTFDSGSTLQTIAVQIADDETVEEEETFVVAMSREAGATVAHATGTIVDNDVAAVELASLQVGGGGAMYPAFDSETHHYALACAAATTLQVNAVAAHGSQSVTLRRAEPDNAVTATGSIDTQVQVDQDHDIAVVVTDGNESLTYVVHCLPPEFPETAVVTRQAGVSDIVLFLMAAYLDELGERVRYDMILDNNGVPRFHRSNPKGWDFRPVRPAGAYRGQTVHYQNVRALYSASFRLIAEVAPWDGSDNDNHDFLVAPNGRFLGLYKYKSRRDLSDFTDPGGQPYGRDGGVGKLC